MIPQNWTPLNEIELGVSVQLKRIKNRSPEELRYLASIGLTTGEWIEVRNSAPLNGPLLVSVNKTELHAIDYRLAMALMVSEENENS
jgi:DtxR family Mn-dependent transcriptional regulator